MLSIGAMKGGQQGYYLDLAREDYYLNGGEPPGIWHGRGAGDLGLAGVVDADALTRLFSGYHPHEDRSLIQQQNYDGSEREHRPGWDLTFSAPKSVSVLWSQADQETRQAIQAAHFAAVKSALNYLEAEVAVTRRGQGGWERLEARLVVATFEHHTSRAEDPQIHTHALVMNACTDARGGSGTVESRPLYRAKMAAGAVYRAEFAARLERDLHLPIVRQGSCFEVAGVSRLLITELSKRRAEIEKALAESGYAGAAAASIATLNTRQKKGHIAQEQLLENWHKIGDAFGWGRVEARHFMDSLQPVRRDFETETRVALREAAARATEQESTFSGLEFTRYLAEECQARGLGERELRAARDSYLSRSDEIVRLGRYKGELVYTTRDMMEQESALLQAVERGSQAAFAGVPEQTVRGLIATRPQFADEQAHALRHITESGGGIRVVSGMAGTGKTTLLHAARLAWELEGFQVHGAALAGQAASGLSREAGIASDTLHRTLLDLENGKLTLGPKSVLVVDEAGMVGTRMMRRTVEFTARAGALLVLTGEERQIQSIEAGGGFSAIKKRVGSANLVEIKRQREEWAREAVKDFADGESGKGLRAYAERGLVTVADDRRQAMEALVEAWKEQGLRNPGEQFILTGTRLEAAILNRMIQQERRNAGLLSGESVSVPDTNETLAAGDRILFIRKSRLYGVENGTQGDVVAVDFGPDTGTASLTVRTDSGDQVRFALQDYAHVRPGYASTTHKKQGGTTERTYILAGGSMQDRELSYVQASRARGDTRIFIDAEEAGENLTRIARRMSQSRQKEMAHTIQERSAQQEDYSQTMGY